VLLAYPLALTLLFKGRYVILVPLQGGSYQSIGEDAAIIAGAWILYAWFATGERGLSIERVLYGLAMIAFGLSHSFYLYLTSPLISTRIPGHVFWAYFTGTAYLAVLLSTLQVVGFLRLGWFPIMLAGKMNDFNWREISVNFALVANGRLVAESYRDMRWFAVWER